MPYCDGVWGWDDAGVNVDIKKSSYKKLSKLLSTYEKKAGPSFFHSPSIGVTCKLLQTAHSSPQNCSTHTMVFRIL